MTYLINSERLSGKLIFKTVKKDIKDSCNMDILTSDQHGIERFTVSSCSVCDYLCFTVMFHSDEIEEFYADRKYIVILSCIGTEGEASQG